MVEKFGMSDKIGLHAEPNQWDGNLMGETLKNLIDEEILSIVNESRIRTSKILWDHKEHLKKLSEELNEKEHLSPEEVKKIITSVNFEKKHTCDMCEAFQKEKALSSDNNSEKFQNFAI